MYKLACENWVTLATFGGRKPSELESMLIGIIDDILKIYVEYVKMSSLVGGVNPPHLTPHAHVHVYRDREGTCTFIYIMT